MQNKWRDRAAATRRWPQTTRSRARVCDAPEVGVNGTRNCKHEHVAAHTRYPTEVCWHATGRLSLSSRDVSVRQDSWGERTHVRERTQHTRVNACEGEGPWMNGVKSDKWRACGRVVLSCELSWRFRFQRVLHMGRHRSLTNFVVGSFHLVNKLSLVECSNWGIVVGSNYGISFFLMAS